MASTWIADLRTDARGRQVIVRHPNAYVGPWRKRILALMAQEHEAFLGVSDIVQIERKPASP